MTSKMKSFLIYQKACADRRLICVKKCRLERWPIAVAIFPAVHTRFPNLDKICAKRDGKCGGKLTLPDPQDTPPDEKDPLLVY